MEKKTDIFANLTGFGTIFSENWEKTRENCLFPELFDAIKRKELRFQGKNDVIREEEISDGVYQWTLIVGPSLMGLTDRLITWFKENYAVQDDDLTVLRKGGRVTLHIVWQPANRVQELRVDSTTKKEAADKPQPKRAPRKRS